MKHNYIIMLAAYIVLASTPAWSNGGIPEENLLDPGYYDSIELEPVIEYNNVKVKYRPLRYSDNGLITARSTRHTTLSFSNTDLDGSFTGYFGLLASIGDDGDFNAGTFTFRSSDEIFGFGSKEYCGWWGCKEIDIVGEVFSGTLTDFGWSEDDGFLEFEYDNLSGAVCDMGWCSNGAHERLWFNVDGGFAEALAEGERWSAIADGAAVIPVPAAIWLFGSGMVALVGFARRKKV